MARVLVRQGTIGTVLCDGKVIRGRALFRSRQ